MGTMVWEAGILILVVLWRLTCGVSGSEPVRALICPVESLTDSILGHWEGYCYLNGGSDFAHFIGVTEGDEVLLQEALNMVHKHRHEYIAMLFYASWCPFSKTFRPSLSILSSLYPSIPHFAFEESAVRPSILSKYGAHGFPTLFLLNSTMRVHYHGSRTLGSLIAFYSDVTGVEPLSLDSKSHDKIGQASNWEKHDNVELESCPFFWARFPGNLLRQETYLALATAFVVLRLLYLVSPKILLFAQFVWRRCIQFERLGSLLELLLAYLNRAKQLLYYAKEPGKRRNFQGRAMNARVWASNSLATVSIGDASAGRSGPVGECS
ncbi:5'-adenylylsulfate reductase-like 4-like [Tripterygium wilfordii]|uniref:5'-adenylylsulfate reductase-like 4-like n=1 Tax=Tripterygium wilfordii TaxID=458696 RepID=A0A7J7DKD9_TRIWF|nr:5'-adenylylsulfate reductase-like 4 [Tripterygium wilfordii]KAF5746801.1 5'-adenylylsulfate reductase-like 4-like [Tripterygium wilfordii]